MLQPVLVINNLMVRDTHTHIHTHAHTYTHIYTRIAFPCKINFKITGEPGFVLLI